MKVGRESLLIALTVLVQAAGPAWSNSPDFVGRFGGGADRPAAGRDGSLGVGQTPGAPARGRYVGNQPVGNNSLAVPQAAKDKGDALFGGRGSSNATMVPGQFSVGTGNALGLTPAGRNEVSRAIIGAARAEAQDGTFNRVNTDSLDGLAQIVGAKLVRGEAVSDDELSVLTQAAGVDNLMTQGTGAPQTALARVADIAVAAKANGGSLTPQQTVEVRTMLDRSTFVPRVNDSGQVINVGAVLRNPAVAQAAPSRAGPGAPPAGNGGATTGNPAPPPGPAGPVEHRGAPPAPGGAGAPIPGGEAELRTDGPALPALGNQSGSPRTPTFTDIIITAVVDAVRGLGGAVPPASGPASGGGAAPATPDEGFGAAMIGVALDAIRGITGPPASGPGAPGGTAAGSAPAAPSFTDVIVGAAVEVMRGISGSVPTTPPVSGPAAPNGGAPVVPNTPPVATGGPTVAGPGNQGDNVRIWSNQLPSVARTGSPSTALPAGNNPMTFSPSVQPALSGRLPAPVVNQVVNSDVFFRPALTNLLNRPAGLEYAASYLSNPSNTVDGLIMVASDFMNANNDFSRLPPIR